MKKKRIELSLRELRHTIQALTDKIDSVIEEIITNETNANGDATLEKAKLYREELETIRTKLQAIL